MIISFFRIETEGLFRGLADYYEKLEAQIPIIRQSEFDNAQGWAEQEAVEFDTYDNVIDELRWTYDYYFPRSLRYSFIVLLFLVVERQLTELCKTLQTKRNIPIKVSDLKGDIIERAKIYIHKLANIPVTVDWKTVEDMSIVRNCIVHTMGDISASRDKRRLQNLVAANIGLSLGHEDFADQDTLQISTEYCSKAAREMLEFFSDLFDAAEIGSRLSKM